MVILSKSSSKIRHDQLRHDQLRHYENITHIPLFSALECCSHEHHVSAPQTRESTWHGLWRPAACGIESMDFFSKNTANCTDVAVSHREYKAILYCPGSLLPILLSISEILHDPNFGATWRFSLPKIPIFGRSYAIVPRKGYTHGQQYLIYHKHATPQNSQSSGVNHTMHYSGLCTSPSIIVLSKTK